jgi:hypothetical protein
LKPPEPPLGALYGASRRIDPVSLCEGVGVVAPPLSRTSAVTKHPHTFTPTKHIDTFPAPFNPEARSEGTNKTVLQGAAMYGYGALGLIVTIILIIVLLRALGAI